MKTNRLIFISSLLLVLTMLLGACNLPSGDATPTGTAGINATQANQTVVARVTEFAALTASPASSDATATPEGETAGTPTETATNAPTATRVPPTSPPTATPVPCDAAEAGNPIDITIPDDTQIVAGSTFTKTWRLVNTGTCTWTTSYSVVWVSGEQMGVEDSIKLSSSVAPNQSVDISVVMEAPTSNGTYQSNWQIRNAGGVLFGIGGDNKGVFWARIQVVQPTATHTPTATLTPTPTATPEVAASGTLTLAASDSADFDSVVLNPGAGADIQLLDGSITLQNGALLDDVGGSAPSKAQCQGATLTGTPVTANSGIVNNYYCFKTDAGRYGYFQVTAVTEVNITIAIVTWVAPQ